LTSNRAAEDRSIALAIGGRIRLERQRLGLTQAALAGARYTKAYISALEKGLSKPSVAALTYIAGRLDVPLDKLLVADEAAWSRLELDVRLASGDWQVAFDGYSALLSTDTGSRRGELLRGLAEAAARLDRGEDAVRAGSEAASLLEGRGRTVDAAWARYWAAAGLYALEQGHEARRHLHRILDQVAKGELEDQDLHVRALIALAMIESRDDEPERALGYLEQARALVGGLDGRRRATFLFSLALSYREVGDFEAAIITANQSLAQFKSAASELETGSVENELALVYLALGQLERARDYVATARTSFEHLQDERLLAHVAETEAQIELAAGRPEQAVARAEEAIRLARATQNRKAELSALLSVAKARQSLGDLGSAIATLDLAGVLAREHARRGQLQVILGELARAYAASGDMQRAFETSQEALEAGRARQSPVRNEVLEPIGTPSAPIVGHLVEVRQEADHDGADQWDRNGDSSFAAFDASREPS
jgi:transcriptional regulator with XRE-family HTH domain